MKNCTQVSCSFTVDEKETGFNFFDLFSFLAAKASLPKNGSSKVDSATAALISLPNLSHLADCPHTRDTVMKPFISSYNFFETDSDEIFVRKLSRVRLFSDRLENKKNMLFVAGVARPLVRLFSH